MRKQYLPRIRKDLNRFTYQQLADAIGLRLSVIWKVSNGKSRGNIETWEKIMRFYDKKR